MRISPVLLALLASCADEQTHRSAHMVCFGFCQRIEVEGTSKKVKTEEGPNGKSTETEQEGAANLSQ